MPHQAISILPQRFVNRAYVGTNEIACKILENGLLIPAARFEVRCDLEEILRQVSRCSKIEEKSSLLVGRASFGTATEPEKTHIHSPDL